MNRIEKIQNALVKKELDAIVLFSEPNVRYAGQFAFTDGAVAVTRGGAVLITDSRYVEAAEAEAKDVTVRNDIPFYSPHAIMPMWGIKLGKRSGYGYKINRAGSVCL